jgi:DNA processing protein
MQMDIALRDRESWLRLWRVPGVGPATFHQLLRLFPSPAEVLRAPPSLLRQLGLSPELVTGIAGSSTSEIEADLRWLDHPDHHLICLDDPVYPPLLREISTPPPLLFVHGDVAALARPQVAIVGSRNASRGAAELAFELAAGLAAHGLVVTSGLAHGIDAQSHRGCLGAGQPTIAVMGSSPDRVYPAVHRRLAQEIVRCGALVTEFAIGAPMRPENFPRRNRIISGLALGVVVVEAAQASGSLITARLALEQGREVFAVPGSVRNPLTRGSHALIRDGAKLVETVADVIEELPASTWFSCDRIATPGDRESRDGANVELSTEQMVTLQAMGFDAVSADELVSRTGLTASGVSSILLTLELAGKVASQPGGLFIRVGPETG